MRINNKRTRRVTAIMSTVLASIIAISVPVYLMYSSSNNNEAKATLAGFSAGNIMSDFVMSNKDTMTESQINNFLHSKNSCNDRDLQKANKYIAKGYRYNIRDGHFVCMADESFDGESAAHIIYRAAQDYSINPQVLITILEKEQGLVTDTWPNSNHQYAAAMGYDCPDNGNGCVSANSGFKRQIRKAAALLHEVLSGGWSNYPAYTTKYIQYSPDKSCGGSNVYIQNRATSALYRYTPYQPNQGALNAGFGTASCGAYGNRNFYNYFTEWFGSTQGFPVSGAIKVRQNQLNSSSNTIGLAIANEVCTNKSTECFQQFQNGYILWSNKTGAWESRGAIRSRYAQLNYEHGVMGYPIGSEVQSSRDGIFQTYEGGVIMGRYPTGYWESKGSIRKRYAQLGYEHGSMGYPVGPEVKSDDGGTFQTYENNQVIMGKSSTGYWESRGSIRKEYAKLNYEHGVAGYPVGPEIFDNATSTWYQKYEHGIIYASAIYGSGFKKY